MKLRFNDNLKKYLKKEKLTKNKFALLAGFKPSTLHDLLKSDQMTLSNVLKIVDYLGSSIDYFEGKTKVFYCDYNKNYSVNLAEQVRMYLKEKNIPIYKMCEDIGISRTNFTRWGRGNSPKYYSVVQIANYLNMSIDKLIGRV